jgi:hypothetical protein
LSPKGAKQVSGLRRKFLHERRESFDDVRENDRDFAASFGEGTFRSRIPPKSEPHAFVEHTVILVFLMPLMVSRRMVSPGWRERQPGEMLIGQGRWNPAGP